MDIAQILVHPPAHRGRMRKPHLALAVLALVALVACGGGDKATNPASDSIAGVYSLRSVNGSPLPYTFQAGEDSYTLTSDVITIANGGTWSETFVFQQTVNGTISEQTGSDSGVWSRAGTSVSLDSYGGYNAYACTFTG
jgi:hypothetical protein